VTPRLCSVAGGDIFDHERQRRAGGVQTEVAPGDALPVGSQTTAVVGTVDLDPGFLEAITFEIDAFGEEREVDGAFAFREPWPPLVILWAVRLPEGDQFEIGAVGERDQRVVGRASGVLATRRDRESEPHVIIRGGREIADRDDDVIDALHVVSSDCSLMPLSRQVCPGMTASAEEMEAGTLLAIARCALCVITRLCHSEERGISSFHTRIRRGDGIPRVTARCSSSA
jgi:hypothetical protein